MLIVPKLPLSPLLSVLYTVYAEVFRISRSRLFPSGVVPTPR